MKNLTINHLRYRVKTAKKSSFGADVKFEKGLNIVYGPNSLGKTSIVTGIIYALGGEKGLGIFKSKQNPFKPEFYDIIEKEKITNSVVVLEISNGEETVCLIRSIIKKTDVVGLKKCAISEFDSITKIDYLKAIGDGTMNEGGLQYFLFNFLSIPIIEVPTYDGNTSKIYLENILPLFFVEQRAGWSQIQARQVTRYGIRDIKKVAFEYILGLDKIESHVIEIQRREVSEKLRRLKSTLEDKEEELIVASNGNRNSVSILLVDHPNYGRINIFDLISVLENKYNQGLKDLENLDENDETETLNTNKSLRTRLNQLEFKLRKSTQKVNNLDQEIKGYISYIERIQINKGKNKQLKIVEGLSLDLNINSCPVCESQLTSFDDGHCKLCHGELKRKISTPDQNLDFLEDEEKSFKSVLKNKQLQRRKEQEIIKDLKLKIKTTEETIEHSINTFLSTNTISLKEKVAELDELNNDIKKFKWISRKWKELDEVRTDISALEKQKETLDKKIKGFEQSKRDYEILNNLLQKIKSNIKALELFRDKSSLINEIKLDQSEEYKPYLERYDIHNIISSSDNVRLMLSYYLGLLQTSVQLIKDTKINFPRLLILDEPKQQNLDNSTLKKLIELIENLPKEKSQILLTTYSHVDKEKAMFEKYICHEMKHDKDYLLKRLIQ
ncbi:MAG: hypothetical protein H6600_03905 [Flavobacteriales bacterium]|nr:hypothetical protein [Flavobacteriales bacterium]